MDNNFEYLTVNQDKNRSDLVFHSRHENCTVCPGSSDPPEKIFNIFFIRKRGLHHLLTITILEVAYYSFTEPKNFRSPEFNWTT